jgi:hypothetical protein
MNHPDHGRRRAARTTRGLVVASVAATAGLTSFVLAGTHASSTTTSGTGTDSTQPAPPAVGGGSPSVRTAPGAAGATTVAPAPLVGPSRQHAPTHATTAGS